jgi:hypothetical protein
MRSFSGALALAAVGVVIGALMIHAATAILTLIIAFGGFVPRADPRPHAIAWMLAAHAAAGAVSGLFLAAAVRKTGPDISGRRTPWVLGSMGVWIAAGLLVPLLLASAWNAPPLLHASLPWLAPGLALGGAAVVLLATRRKRF